MSDPCRADSEAPDQASPASGVSLAELLAQRTAELADLYDNAPCGYHSLAPDGTFLRVNDTELRWLGYERAELVGKKRLGDLMTAPDRLSIERYWRVLTARPGVMDMESRLVKKDGSILPVSLNITCVRDAEGKLVEIRSTVFDITARKQAEEILRRSRDTLSLANATLERASRSKDEFLAAMSHELRTPLNAVLGLSEALQENVYGPVADRQRKALRNIEESGRHLLSLIGDILDISKIEAGKVELDLQVIGVEDICRAALRMVEEASGRKHQELNLVLDGAPDRLHADQRRLKQILVNLLSNAVKFTPDGGRVELAARLDVGGDAIRFTVSDTGVGIARDELGRAFQAFVQLDSSLSRRHAGTGLGLALVCKLVDLHGGGLAVDSEPGAGSTFSVILPYTPPHEDPPKPSRPPRGPGGGALRALVVEDSAPAAEQLERYLLESDVSTAVHPQGDGVVERAAEEQPQVILLDILLPAEVGWEVLRELKGDPRTKHIPVIVVSALSRREQGRAFGADDYLVKPVTRAQLHAAVARVTSGRGAARPVLIVEPRRASQLPSVARILIAEDDETNVSTLIELFESRGYETFVARNGQEAIRQAQDVRPDLILMDMQMPVLDGLTAMEAIRADAAPELRDVPIVVLTALEIRGDRERCLLSGASRYLAKPVKAERLAAVIDELLAPRKIAVR